MTSLSALYARTRRLFAASGIETPDLDARILICDVLGLSDVDFILQSDRETTEDEIVSLEAAFARRLRHEPVSRILGYRYFAGHRFHVSSAVLDPRPDTETLIDAVQQRFIAAPPRRILDLGTGSGCILLTLLALFPEATGVGVDISPQALETARQNAESLGVAKRASFICSDWGDKLEGTFDLVVSNPPYIKSEVIPELDPDVRHFDPILALDGGFDGLEAYKKIFSQLDCMLSQGGHAFFEIGFDQGDELKRLVDDSAFQWCGLHVDIAGRPRVVEIANGDK